MTHRPLAAAPASVSLVSLFLAAFLIVLLAGAAGAQPIQQARGVDSRVDYASLVRIGPWDDRNYALTADDLAFLPADEALLRDPIPAFFRVELRQRWKADGLALELYPRSAYNEFRQVYGGYLVDGVLYAGVTVAEDGRFVVLTEERLRVDPVSRALLGEVRVTSPTSAAESSVEINHANPSRVIAGSNGPGGGQRMHYSDDGGETWTQVDLPLGGTCCDPTVAWSSDGTLAYAATLGLTGSCCGVWVYRSSNAGVSWDDFSSLTPGDPRREIATSNSDKEFLHVDIFPTSPHRDNVYLTWHRGNVMQFGVSTDFGDSWSVTAFATEPRGIGSDITTDAAGTIYYLYPSFTGAPVGPGAIRLLKSTDGGLTFGPSTVVSTTEDEFDYPVPSMETRRVFQYVSADVDLTGGPFGGSVYAAWSDTTAGEQAAAADNHSRIQVAFSRDQGSTWTVLTPHPTADILTVDRYHQWLAVDDDGNVHLIFYDTSADGDRNTTDIFYTRSRDGAATWSAPERITTVTSTNIANGFEWGDYNGLSIALQDLIAIYTDNRNEGGGGGDSIDIYAIGRANYTPIFSDGFESGTTAAWSDSQP